MCYLPWPVKYPAIFKPSSSNVQPYSQLSYNSSKPCRTTLLCALFVRFATVSGDPLRNPMLELRTNTLSFSFPDVHPNARAEITFHRTLRIPDDERTYALPPSLGAFPVRHVDDFSERVPEKWLKHGGVMLPMYQSEAMWMSFRSMHMTDYGVPYPFALKIATGKRSAVTGRVWSKALREKDYVILPLQPWLDGYVVEEGVIRQFVAAPLGMGLTAEEQLSGEAKHGGLQIEVLPMKREHFDRRFPKLPPRPIRPTRMRYGSDVTKGGFSTGQYDLECLSFNGAAPASAARSLASADMGLAPGGQMKQQIFEDPYGVGEWDDGNKSRCFVHLANSLTWRAITGAEPPNTPLTSAEYNRYGMPWFDYYRDDAKALDGTDKTKGLKSLMQLGFQKGLLGILPENNSTEPKRVIDVSPVKKDQVRDGSWR